jgi:hypothetical protein
MDQFEGQAVKLIIGNIIAWAVFGGAALFINKTYGSAGERGRYKGDMINKCKSFHESSFKRSMINTWIMTDIAVSMISMPCLVFQYYMDKKAYENQWIELIVHTQKNALKKFY